MELSGRPLLDTKPDHKLFAGRERELERLLTSVDRRLNVLLIGGRGTGKTTLLRQVAYALHQRGSDQPPAFVNGHQVDNAKLFIDLVRFRLGLDPAVLEPSPMQSAFEVISGRATLADTLELSRLVRGLREAAPEGRRVVLVDELPNASVGQTLFGQLRDELWQLPLTWVVAVSENDEDTLLSPPADAFFDVIVRLEPLSKEAQREILQARIGSGGSQIAAELDEGNPRRLLELAREALEAGTPPSELLYALARRDVEASKLGRSASMLMAELESLGPTSASDQRLLSRLGWTRSRAVQVFRQLEEKGLVTSSTVKGASGRPRKLYKPTDPRTRGGAGHDT